MTAQKSNEVLATEVNNLGKEVSDFKSQMAKEVGELKAQFVMFQTSFVRNDVYSLKHSELETRVAANSADIKTLKSSKWWFTIAGVVLGGVLVYLINYALTHRGV